MPKRGKSDKRKLKEGKGLGSNVDYESYLKVHEFGSVARVHRLLGWITGRVHQLMSDLELYFFLLLQWNDKVIDIREQFPLLPKEQTMIIANELGIRHPAISNKAGQEVVMTTDFMITLKDDEGIRNIVRTVKPKIKLTERRVLEKLQIEKEFFKMKGIDWGIVTEEQINKKMAQNVYSIYNCYCWNKEKNMTEKGIKYLVDNFKEMLIENNYDVLKTIFKFEDAMRLEKGEGLRFFKYLLATKVIGTDMDILFNYNTMKVWIKGEYPKR